MRILDYDFLIAFLRGDPETIAMAKTIINEGIYGTTAMNAVELYIGTFKRPDKIGAVTRLLNKFEILPLDGIAAKAVVNIFASCAKEGKMIDIKDAIIAGIALTGGHTVITRNNKHFERVEGLSVERW